MSDDIVAELDRWLVKAREAAKINAAAPAEWLTSLIDRRLVERARDEIVALRAERDALSDNRNLWLSRAEALEELAGMIDQPPWHTDPQNGALASNSQFVTRREIAAAISALKDKR